MLEFDMLTCLVSLSNDVTILLNHDVLILLNDDVTILLNHDVLILLNDVHLLFLAPKKPLTKVLKS